jgi:hypothetical protein
MREILIVRLFTKYFGKKTEAGGCPGTLVLYAANAGAKMRE